jgi:UDP-glucose 4-epimerase
MNILLTGGLGYIGSHTAVSLFEAGFNVVFFDNLSNAHFDVVRRLEIITQKKISFVEGDVRNTPLVADTLKRYNIDSVIHFAGSKAVGDSVLDPLGYFDNNVGGTISLLKAMKENQVKSLVFSSSATVYGEPHYLPLDENHPTQPLNPYGRTKLHIEEMLQDLVMSDSSWGVISLRYFNPVGAHDSILLGENPIGTPNNLMPYISQVAAGVLPKVYIFGNDYDTVDGTGVRDYIHVIDLASGHLAAINFLTVEKGWQTFNLGTGVGTSVLQIINQFSLLSGRKIPYEIASRRSGDLSSCFASAEKAKKILKWKTERNLESMCGSAWKWQESIK